MIRSFVAVGSIVVGVASMAAAQADGETPEITIRHVAGAISMLEGRGGNVGVSVGVDGILIVDDQFAFIAPRIREALRELSDAPVAFVLNTHHHSDHTGGNATFGTEARIVAHSRVRARLSRPKDHKKEALPIVTFDESLSLHFNGEEIRMKYFPNGHSDSDVVIWFTGSKVVHMGDLMFTGSFPSFYPVEGGGIDAFIRNVGEIIPMLPEGVAIIPGHGPLATVQDVKDFHAMLAETTEIVRGYVAEGKTLAEARTAGLPEKYAAWVSSYTSVEQWVASLYRDLAK